MAIFEGLKFGETTYTKTATTMGYSCKTLLLKNICQNNKISTSQYNTHLGLVTSQQKDSIQMQPMSCLLNGLYTDHYLILTQREGV